MSKKISKEQFLSRFYRNYPDAEILLLDYTAISNPLTIRCEKCQKQYQFARARDLLNRFGCCGRNKTERKIDVLKKLYSQNSEFEFVKQVDKDHYIVHHNKCGCNLKRVIATSLDNPFACSTCETLKKAQMLDISEVQERIDEVFGGSIQILDYNGQLEKNHYKCLKCGLIFSQKQICLMQSRGCPKCDRWKSKGEKTIAHLLEKSGLSFKEQVVFEELPLQRFDFGVYDGEQLLYLIEVQGEQHYKNVSIFKDNLEKIQERDNRKRRFCEERKIPLCELIYRKGKFLNLDILPLNSTTISVKENTLQAKGK